MKYITVVALALVLSTAMTLVAFAESDHEDIAAQGKALVESKIACADLHDDQLEAIGEYVMDQMHPGDQHEVMDTMMGGEGSESLRQAHIALAQRFYCGEATGMGMMGGSNMMGYAGSGMMGGNMMNWGESKTNQQGSMMGYTGMMGGFSSWHAGFRITSILVWLFLLSGIAAFAKYLLRK